VLYDVILEYMDADGEWKSVSRENFPENGIEVVLPAVKGTTPATHVYKVAHMFTMNMRGKNAGDVEYPVPTAYQNEKGEWMLKFTVNGLSPIMVAAVPIPAVPQTGDTSDVRLYAMLLVISVMGIAAAKRRRTE